MIRTSRFARSQRMTIVNAMLVLVVILVMVQLWLLTATVNAYLGGDEAILIPACAASVLCFALALGLLRYLYRLE